MTRKSGRSVPITLIAVGEVDLPPAEVREVGRRRGESAGIAVVLEHGDWPEWCFTVGFTADGEPVGFSMAPRSGWRFDLAEQREYRGLDAPADVPLDQPSPPPRANWSFVKQTFPRGSEPITARRVRSVPVGELVAAARSVWLEEAWWRAGKLEWLEESDKAGEVTAEYKEYLRTFASGLGERPGRRGREDHFYAALAALYVDKLGTTHAPVAELADELGYSASQVANLLYEARHRRGLLTTPPKGRAGGVLTPKGLQVLEDAQDSEGTS